MEDVVKWEQFVNDNDIDVQKLRYQLRENFKRYI